MNPYDIDISTLKESSVVTDPHELMKYKLAGLFVKAIKDMPNKEVLEKTGLDKSDLSRIYMFNFKRFSIDKFFELLDRVGFTVEVKIKKKKAAQE
jgi:predicted XRE-type DNA-binding protein